MDMTPQPPPAGHGLPGFDRRSGSIIERLLLNNRPVILLACLMVTIFLSFEAVHVRLNASFDQMIPTQQDFIKNYLAHYAELQGQGNAIRIAVSADQRGIIDPHYLSVLQELNDQVILLPGVDRSFMQSLWTPNTRWIQVTRDGLQPGQ